MNNQLAVRLLRSIMDWRIGNKSEFDYEMIFMVFYGIDTQLVCD